MALHREFEIGGRHAGAVILHHHAGRCRRPPSVTAMRVAPASSAFSTSSFTTAAGRSTTSPAAMRLAVVSGRMRMGMESRV